VRPATARCSIRRISPDEDGAILCNSGHFDVEIDIAYSQRLGKKIDRNVTNHVDSATCWQTAARCTFWARGGWSISPAPRVIPRGDGHELRHAGARRALDRDHRSAAIAVHNVPPAIDEEVASLKLAAMSIKIDTLSAEQKSI